MTDQAGGDADVSIRRGQADDWPAVAPIVANTWGDDGDYINEVVWRGWCADAEGSLVTAIGGGKIVGLGRVTHVGPSEWWLEGLRVAPDRRGEGIGGVLMDHLVSWFKAHGDGILRMSTDSQNDVSQKLAQQHGFRHTVSYMRMEGASQPTSIGKFKLLQAHNVDMVFSYVRHAPMYRVNHFAENYWKLYYVTRERLAEYLSDPNVLVAGWRELDHLHGVAIAFTQPPAGIDGEEETLYIGYLDAPDDTTAEAMLNGLRGLAAHRGKAKIAWKMPTGMGLERVAARAGVTSVWDFALWLYERPIR